MNFKQLFDYFKIRTGKIVLSLFAMLALVLAIPSQGLAQPCDFTSINNLMPINYFSFGSNFAVNFGDTFYGHATVSSPTIDAYRGTSYDLRVEAGFYDLTNNPNNYYPCDVKIWIDYNDDGKFDESTERIFFSDKSDPIDGPSDWYHVTTITIPPNVDVGSHILRVANDYYDENVTGDVNSPYGCAPSGKSSSVYGEGIDFTINIAPGNDAGVTAGRIENARYVPGMQKVFFTIKNFADKPLQSVTIKWSVDGTEQAPFYWTGTLNSLEEVEVEVGSYDFQLKNPKEAYEVTAWTENPNNRSDEEFDNDKLPSPITTAPSLIPGNYEIGSGKEFANFNHLTQYLNDYGIIGDGELTFDVFNGTYNEQFALQGFQHDDNQFMFHSYNGNPASVKMSFTAYDPALNYIIRVADPGLSATFENMTFESVADEGSFGVVFNLQASQGVYLNNNVIIGQQMTHPSPMADFTLIYMNGTGPADFNAEGNSLMYGSNGVYAELSGGGNKINFSNNKVEGFVAWGYFGMSEEGSNVTINDNEFTGIAQYHGVGGIYSNTTTVTGNYISGLVGTGDVTEAGIRIMHDPRSSDQAIVNNNIVENCMNVSGIWVQSMNGTVNWNYVVIEHYTDFTWLSGITIENSGNGGSMDCSFNEIYSYDANGLTLLNSDGKYFYNYIYTEGYYWYDRAAVLLEGTKGVLATNMIIGNNANGILLAGTRGVECYYNSINTYSDFADKTSKGQDHIQGENGFHAIYFFVSNRDFYPEGIKQNGDTPMQGLLSDATIMRNIAYCTDWGEPIGGPDIGNLTSDYNNLYTENGLFDLAVWQGQGYDEHSVSIPVTYADNDDLHLLQYDRKLYVDFPLNSGHPFDQEFEDYDWDNEFRSFYYFGVDNLYPQVEVIEQPETIVDCFGASGHMFTSVATASLGSRPLYQWQKNGMDIPGETGSIFFLDDLTFDMSGVYRCKVIAEGGDDVEYTEDVLLYVLTDPAITRQPDDATADLGETVMFEVQAHIRGDLPPEYQPTVIWKKDGVELENNDHVAGADASIMSITNIQDTDFSDDYTVTLIGHCGEVTSDPISLKRKPGIDVKTQPVDVEACEDQTASFLVEDSLTNGGTDVTYQWRHDGMDLTDDGRISGANTANLSINNLMPSDAGEYVCVFTLQPGDIMVMSDAAMLTIDLMPVITEQPMDVTVAESASFTVSVTAENADSYQWYLNGTEITGAVDADYTVNSADSSNVGEYSCKVTNGCGEVMSDTAVVMIDDGGIIMSLEDLTGDYALGVNNPNPFSGTTSIEFKLPVSMHVTITLMDASGRQVAELFNDNAQSGITKIDIDAAKLDISSGVYYYTIKAGNYTETKQMVLIK